MKREANRRAADLRDIRRESGEQALVGELRFVRTWIDADVLAAEPWLAQMAWVENRYLSPLERTEAFTKAYIAKVRRVYRKRYGEVAAGSKPLEEQFVLNSAAEMNALWRARAEADRFGVPYDLYLDVVIDGHVLEDKWERPPRPNQLYGKLAGPRLRDRLTGLQLSYRLEVAEDPRFQIDAYQGEPVQEEMLRLIKQDVEASENQAAVLARYLTDRRVTVERARSLLGASIVEAALTLCGEPPPQMPKAVSTFRPACFGHFEPASRGPCESCSVRESCASVADLVREALIRVTGSDNPRLEHKRRVDRERQRRYRARKRKVIP